MIWALPCSAACELGRGTANPNRALFPSAPPVSLHIVLQARQARSRSSLSKRMLPIRLGLIKRTLYQLTTGSTPTTALSAAATAAAPASVKPSAQPLQFTDSAVADVIADIEAQAAAGPRTPLGLPTLPQPGTTKQDKQQQGEGKDLQDKRQTPRGSSSSSGKGLQERRSGRGLLPGQWDPAAQEALVDRRSRELLQHKSYLRNFWYAAGEQQHGDGDS